MKTKLGFVLLMALTLATASADAHQCANIGTFPELGSFLLRKPHEVRLFCSACGDKAPTAPFVVVKAIPKPGAPAWSELMVITDTRRAVRTVSIGSIWVRLDPKRAIYTNLREAVLCWDREPRTLP